MFKKILVTTLLALTGPLAFAVPVHWQLSDVTFADSTAATGFFTYDADTNDFSDWNISVFSGTLSAFTYNTATSRDLSVLHSPGAGIIFADLGTFITRYLNLKLVETMTNAGGTIALLTTATPSTITSGSWECANCNPVRSITGGSITTAVPEPATIALFGLGLLVVGLARRRKN